MVCGGGDGDIGGNGVCVCVCVCVCVKEVGGAESSIRDCIG